MKNTFVTNTDSVSAIKLNKQQDFVNTRKFLYIFQQLPLPMNPHSQSM